VLLLLPLLPPRVVINAFVVVVAIVECLFIIPMEEFCGVQVQAEL
jgi:hypothetical protein